MEREVDVCWKWMAIEVGARFFFFNDTATTEIYTLSLHDALPICAAQLLEDPDWLVRAKAQSLSAAPIPS